MIVEGNPEVWMLELQFITLIFLHLCHVNCELQWHERKKPNSWLWLFRNWRSLLMSVPGMSPVSHVQSRKHALEFRTTACSCLCPTLIQMLTFL